MRNETQHLREQEAPIPIAETWVWTRNFDAVRPRIYDASFPMLRSLTIHSFCDAERATVLLRLRYQVREHEAHEIERWASAMGFDIINREGWRPSKIARFNCAVARYVCDKTGTELEYAVIVFCAQLMRFSHSIRTGRQVRFPVGTNWP